MILLFTRLVASVFLYLPYFLMACAVKFFDHLLKSFGLSWSFLLVSFQRLYSHSLYVISTETKLLFNFAVISLSPHLIPWSNFTSPYYIRVLYIHRFTLTFTVFFLFYSLYLNSVSFHSFSLFCFSSPTWIVLSFSSSPPFLLLLLLHLSLPLRRSHDTAASPAAAGRAPDALCRRRGAWSRTSPWTSVRWWCSRERRPLTHADVYITLVRLRCVHWQERRRSDWLTERERC